MLLKGKVALITGATGSIGQAIAAKFLENGAFVIIHYCSNEKKAHDITKNVPGSMERVMTVRADLTDLGDVEAMMGTISRRFTHIDILVNNAGTSADKLITLMSEKEWNGVIDLNLTGTFNTIQATLKHLIRAKGSRIVNVSSATAICGQVTRVNYGTSKAAVIGLTRALSKELAGHEILVNAVAPAIIDSGLADKLPMMQKQIHKAMTPLKRLGTSDDVANAVLFLSSPMSGYITGEIITISGGEVSWYL
ncbi:MAG: SDR family oxidoreductase [Oligoflexales bacterium]|nr:SDR family oxidoreductase [Oligoflexales bacterium]